MTRAAAFAAVVILLVVAGCGREPAPTPTRGSTPSVPRDTASPSAPASTATPLPRPSPSPGSSTTVAPEERTYTVQPGDTLFSIARRFGTTADDIAARNSIADPNRIETGMVLVIPSATVPTPSPDVPTPSTLIRHGDRASRVVALTFDMGGRVEPALDIMRWLIARGVPATIFITGAMVESPNTDAGREVVALVAAHPELFELGNHSYSHPDFRELDADAIRRELLRTEAAVAAAAPGLAMRPRFRPPYGGVDEAVLAAVGAVGYGQTVLWDIDTIDWRPVSEGGPTAAEIAAKVVGQAQGGSIILMHLGGYETLAALPAIVDGLLARGFTLVRVSEVVPSPTGAVR